MVVWVSHTMPLKSTLHDRICESGLFLGSNLEYASDYICQQCHETSIWFCMNNQLIQWLLLFLIQNHVLTVIVDTKPCAYHMVLLTKIMRCILQVKA